MDFSIIIFLSSGLFLGWSLGANDASNVFGTAVAGRMIRFGTAAVVCSVFLVLGAVIGGAGAAHGLGKLGSVNTLPGSFMAAFTAALTVYWMTKAKLPVSTSQAIVGAIVGWNFYSGSITDLTQLSKICMTWVACPILGAVFSFLLYKITVQCIYGLKINLFKLDFLTRFGLILAGAFGSYSLGANNIGNVMGVFVASSPFNDSTVFGLFTFTSIQKLFLLGALAITVGVFTYSKRVMMTVGSSIIQLNPVAAWVVVVSHSMVLYLFSSTELEHLLVSNGLPAIPLIPVSSSQAVVGAVIGIGICQGWKQVRQIKWKTLADIAGGWVSTPVIAAVLCYFLLFFLANVFDQNVYKETYYHYSKEVGDRLNLSDEAKAGLAELKNERIAKATVFRKALRKYKQLDRDRIASIISASQIYTMRMDPEKLKELDKSSFEPDQLKRIYALKGNSYQYKWQLDEDLADDTGVWSNKPDTAINKDYNKKLQEKRQYLYQIFFIEDHPQDSRNANRGGWKNNERNK